MRKADSNTTASVLQHKFSVFYFIHLFFTNTQHNCVIRKPDMKPAEIKFSKF